MIQQNHPMIQLIDLFVNKYIYIYVLYADAALYYTGYTAFEEHVSLMSAR